MNDTDIDNDDHIQSTTSIILAIDVGSSSVRCTAYHYSEENNAIATTSIDGCSSSIQRPGVEPIAGSIRTNGLFEAVDSAVDEVLSKLRAKFVVYNEKLVVEAVGFSTFAMNLIAVDNCGKLIPFEQNSGNDGDKKTGKNSSNSDETATTIGISYACNAPDVHAECRQLRQEIGLDALDRLYQATGAPLHSAYALPQLRVLYNGGKLQTSHRWQSIAGYCLSRWTNRSHIPMTYSEASWTGLLNVRDCVFEESAIQLLPPSCRAALPELTDFTDYVHGIPQFLHDSTTNPYWTKFPELRNAKFFLGIGDGACANVGSKCTSVSRIAVTVGTSAAVRMCLRHEAFPISSSSSADLPFRIPDCRGLFCYRIDRNHVLVGGALTDGGSLVEWASRFLNLEKDESAFQNCLEETRKLVEAECQQQEEKSSNRHRELIMAPFLSGERSTGFRDGAAGAVFGLTRETTPAHFFKSCLEGVSLRLKAVIDLLLVVVDCNKLENEDENTCNGNTKLPVMVASGKAMEVNHLWRQMIADSCGLRVVLDEGTAEGTSRGVARLVSMSLMAERVSSSAIAGVSNDTDEKQKKISLDFAKHEEEVHPSLTSQPRLAATSMFKRKLLSQEGFIGSIAPFFSSS